MAKVALEELRWEQWKHPADCAIAIFTDGTWVVGWVRSKSGLMWEALLPVPGRKSDNLSTGGRFVGLYPKVATAMEVVEAKAIPA